MKDYSRLVRICQDRMLNYLSIKLTKVERKEIAVYGPVMSSATNFLPSTSFNHPQPKIEATDRRQIEALNEDKSHTTKEALDDFRRVHLKENGKKEQDNMEQYQTGFLSGGSVSKLLSFNLSRSKSFTQLSNTCHNFASENR